jgi:hypothetical protein
MTDADRLRNLAKWFDVTDTANENSGDELRRIAARLEAAEEYEAAIKKCFDSEIVWSWRKEGYFARRAMSSLDENVVFLGPFPTRKEAILAVYRASAEANTGGVQ